MSGWVQALSDSQDNSDSDRQISKLRWIKERTVNSNGNDGDKQTIRRTEGNKEAIGDKQIDKRKANISLRNGR